MNNHRSFFYRNSRIYLFLLKLTHGINFTSRYTYMAGQIGTNKSVLEPGAGPGVIVPFLDHSCTYHGFDLNVDFVADAKQKGMDIVYGNMLDKSMYRASDAAVLIDVLHHLLPKNQTTLLTNTLKAVKDTIVICEPFEHGRPAFSKIPWLSRMQRDFFNYIEQDGNNEARSEHVHSKSALRQDMENGFGIIPKRTKKEIVELGSDLIVTYHLNA